MLAVTQLTRSFDSFVAVDNVSFTIKKGEIIGLLGPNGAGKTTIMKMLSGYLEPDQGEITFNGQSVSNNSEVLKKALGYLPESLPVYPELSVAEYLDYAADLKGLTSPEKEQEIKRAIKATDISAKLLAPISTLSRGYKQRVAVAQAILGKPQLLILDEPTNGLDPEQTQHMRQLIKRIAEDATVILSTHIMQEVEAVCDRVLMVRSGELVVDEKLESLKNSNTLLLDSDCEEAALIEEIAGVSKVEKLNDSQYQITVTKHDFIRKVSAEIVRVLVNASYQVFSIAQQKRDLETLFNQVNSGAEANNALNKEVSHAA